MLRIDPVVAAWRPLCILAAGDPRLRPGQRAKIAAYAAALADRDTKVSEDNGAVFIINDLLRASCRSRAPMKVDAAAVAQVPPAAVTPPPVEEPTLICAGCGKPIDERAWAKGTRYHGRACQQRAFRERAKKLADDHLVDTPARPERSGHDGPHPPEKREDPTVEDIPRIERAAEIREIPPAQPGDPGWDWQRNKPREP